MNPICVTVTGRLGDDPRIFTTRDGTDGVELRLALDIPARGAGEGVTRWIKVTAFGLLATRTGESVRKGDRVTVVADDLIAEAWGRDRHRRAPRPAAPIAAGAARTTRCPPSPVPATHSHAPRPAPRRDPRRAELAALRHRGGHRERDRQLRRPPGQRGYLGREQVAEFAKAQASRRG